MDKFDKLSLLSNKKDDEVIVSVIEPKIEKKEDVQKRPTVFSAFLATLKQDKSRMYPTKGAVLPNLRSTVNCFVALVFLSAVMVASWYFIDKMVFIPVALLFLSIAIPCLILVFYYEFDVGHQIPLGKLLLLAIVGALTYILVSQVISEVFYLIFYESLVDSVIVPIITNVVMFAVVFLATSFFQSRSVRDYFLIVAFLVMGYVMCECFVNGFSSLFISGKVGDNVLYNIRIIVDNEEMLEKSMKKLLDGMVYDFIVWPFLCSCWGTIYAYLMYYLADSKRKKNEIPRSMYLLIFLVIILNILAVADTSMVSFNVILKCITTAISVYILVKLLNFSFDENPPEPLTERFKN